MSAHPEDARLAASGPRDVTLYTRPGCHLCDEAKTAIVPLLREFRAVLQEVNIDADPVLKERYGWDLGVKDRLAVRKWQSINYLHQVSSSVKS